MNEQPTPDKIMQIGLGFWGSKTLLSAVELGLFTELGKGPLDFGTLAGRLGLHQRSARDFLDALVALRVLERVDDHCSNTPEADLFLDRAKPSYVGGILEMANARLYPFGDRSPRRCVPANSRTKQEEGRTPSPLSTPTQAGSKAFSKPCRGSAWARR